MQNHSNEKAQGDYATDQLTNYHAARAFITRRFVSNFQRATFSVELHVRLQGFLLGENIDKRYRNAYK